MAVATQLPMLFCLTAVLWKVVNTFISKRLCCLGFQGAVLHGLPAPDHNHYPPR
jgi:hypothetical protein